MKSYVYDISYETETTRKVELQMVLSWVMVSENIISKCENFILSLRKYKSLQLFDVNILKHGHPETGGEKLLLSWSYKVLTHIIYISIKSINSLGISFLTK
jgi:hypothetical protein